jgi:predicted GTPase
MVTRTLVVENVNVPTLEYQTQQIRSLIERNSRAHFLTIQEWDALCGINKLLDHMVEKTKPQSMEPELGRHHAS